ncbi:MAG: hypothetical protein QOE61_4440, partial [Micromonosporaceae bacterium]|nr:hypothetical protein [Micromonosporaceae bacterium]
ARLPARSDPARGTTVESRAGLQRRRPGEHLDSSLRDEIPGYRRIFPAGQGADSQASLADRNAEAERTALSDYSYGLARASESIAAQDPDHYDDTRSRP